MTLSGAVDWSKMAARQHQAVAADAASILYNVYGPLGRLVD